MAQLPTLLEPSDGSAVSTGQRIARNNGPAYGSRTSSFRAEAYGILSFLCLLHRAFEYTATPLPPGVNIYTDSESVLKTLPKMLYWPFYFPAQTLTAEWDILQAIVSKLKLYGERPQLKWVEGHQD